jgi:Rrf2 family nitric oxide-sensitive transcriptional repressor
MYVGAKGNKLSTIDEIAESYGISRNHLSKVVFRLAQLGFLETVRGKGGGMRLACPPEAVNLGKLVRSTEDDLELVECFGTTNANCCIDSACLLRKVLRDALSAFFEVLDDYTLADLLKPKRHLRRLLHISASP